ncbi:MAG: aminopeptidase P family protein [Ruminococcaceae bacterium]|nr:aminopeptidase P family protein [Oscillospiraceae bacterium]
MSLDHIRSLQQKLTENEAEAALLTDKLNQRYLSGFDFDDGYVLVTQKNAYLVTDFRYIEAAKAASADFMEVVAPERGTLFAFLVDSLKKDGCKTVLLEEETLAYAAFGRFVEKLSDFTVKGGASAILNALRLYKTDEELAAMARAQTITDAAFAHIVKTIRPDEMTEIDVALEMECFMRSHGASGLAFDTIVASGSASSRPHAVPRNCKLERGFLTLDFGAKADGYCSDMTRTIVLGKADAEMKKLYNTVLRAQTEAIAAAREGSSCFGLDKIARDIINGAGYEGRFGHSLGHGVGLFIHEKPNLAPGVSPDLLLKRGHTFTVEPGIYIEGLYGCRIEDMCCIRPDGTMQDFTQSPKELIEI